VVGDSLGGPGLRVAQTAQFCLLGWRPWWQAHDPQTQGSLDDCLPSRGVDDDARAQLGIGNLLQHRKSLQQVPPNEDVAGHVGSCEPQLVGGPQQPTQGIRTGDGQL
jgi:hypothetical protein